jgi:hypothetical protein
MVPSWRRLSCGWCLRDRQTALVTAAQAGGEGDADARDRAIFSPVRGTAGRDDGAVDGGRAPAEAAPAQAAPVSAQAAQARAGVVAGMMLQPNVIQVAPLRVGRVGVTEAA